MKVSQILGAICVWQFVVMVSSIMFWAMDLLDAKIVYHDAGTFIGITAVALYFNFCYKE